MTLAAQILTDVAEVFFQEDDFAETVLRYVGGDSGNASTILAVVTLQPPEPDDMRGRGYVYRGSMILKEAVTITAQDAIKFDGNRYEVETIGDAQYGMRTVQLIRYQPESQGGRPLKLGDH